MKGVDAEYSGPDLDTYSSIRLIVAGEKVRIREGSGIRWLDCKLDSSAKWVELDSTNVESAYFVHPVFFLSAPGLRIKYKKDSHASRRITLPIYTLSDRKKWAKALSGLGIEIDDSPALSSNSYLRLSSNPIIGWISLAIVSAVVTAIMIALNITHDVLPCAIVCFMACWCAVALAGYLLAKHFYKNERAIHRD